MNNPEQLQKIHHFFKIKKMLGIGAPKFNPNPPSIPAYSDGGEVPETPPTQVLGSGRKERGYDQGGIVQDNVENGTPAPEDSGYIQAEPEKRGYGTMAPAAMATGQAVLDKTQEMVDPRNYANPNVQMFQPNTMASLRAGQNPMTPEGSQMLQNMALAGSFGPMGGEGEASPVGDVADEIAEKLGQKNPKKEALKKMRQ